MPVHAGQPRTVETMIPLALYCATRIDRVGDDDQNRRERSHSTAAEARLAVFGDGERARVPQPRRHEHRRHEPPEPGAGPHPHERNARQVMQPDCADERARADLRRRQRRAPHERAERPARDDEVGRRARAPIPDNRQSDHAGEVRNQDDGEGGRHFLICAGAPPPAPATPRSRSARCPDVRLPPRPGKIAGNPDDAEKEEAVEGPAEALHQAEPCARPAMESDHIIAAAAAASTATSSHASREEPLGTTGRTTAETAAARGLSSGHALQSRSRGESSTRGDRRPAARRSPGRPARCRPRR